MSKNFRQLQIFYQLQNGFRFSKQELVDQFNVSPRAIQRDISELNDFLADISNHLTSIEFYDHHYQLHTDQHTLSNRELLAIIKILLASRGLNKSEMNSTINGLLNLMPKKNRQQLSPLIANELFYYHPLTHGADLLTKIWELSLAITHHETLQIKYLSRDNKKTTRSIQPRTIIFSEYYFYIISYSSTENMNYIYRIDRIISFQSSSKKNEHLTKFDEGIYRQRSQFMYPGPLIHVKFQFWGTVEAALDRIPTAKISHTDSTDNSVIIDCDVYGERGIMMWLLSQGSLVKVLGPSKLVNSMKEEIDKMKGRY